MGTDGLSAFTYIIFTFVFVFHYFDITTANLCCTIKHLVFIALTSFSTYQCFIYYTAVTCERSVDDPSTDCREASPDVHPPTTINISRETSPDVHPPTAITDSSKAFHDVHPLINPIQKWIAAWF